MKKALLGLLVVSALAGCASTGTKEGAAVQDKSGQGAAASGASQAAVNPLTDPNNILSKRSVYFDFDSNVVKDEYKPMIEAHAKYLNSNAAAKIMIQGNADERGSREYNLALGQRRADAVRKVMTVLGVKDGQIETVSYGEEKPKAEGHDEAAYSQNRRGDIVYSGE